MAVSNRSEAALFDHLIGAGEHGRRNREAERLRDPKKCLSARGLSSRHADARRELVHPLVLPRLPRPTETHHWPLKQIRPQAGMMRYLDQTATATAIVVAIRLTDHLFSPIGTTVKQLAFSRPQLVQKPCALSLHVPALLLPDSARGSRVIFPSGVKVILNLTPLSVAAVKGWPLKNVAWMLLGAMGSAAKALLAWKSIVATTNGSARIEPRGDGQPLKIQFG
jgi:hypothetical protein